MVSGEGLRSLELTSRCVMLEGFEDEARRQGLVQERQNILHEQQNSPLLTNNLSVFSKRIKITKNIKMEITEKMMLPNLCFMIVSLF